RHTRFDCDWSSDVCSPIYLSVPVVAPEPRAMVANAAPEGLNSADDPPPALLTLLNATVPLLTRRNPLKELLPARVKTPVPFLMKIGRASCRERGSGKGGAG